MAAANRRGGGCFHRARLRLLSASNGGSIGRIAAVQPDAAVCSFGGVLSGMRVGGKIIEVDAGVVWMPVYGDAFALFGVSLRGGTRPLCDCSTVRFQARRGCNRDLGIRPGARRGPRGISL